MAELPQIIEGVDSLVRQGKTREEVRKFIQDNGINPDEFLPRRKAFEAERAQTAANTSVPGDMAMSAASGLGEGVAGLPGMVGDVQQLRKAAGRSGEATYKYITGGAEPWFKLDDYLPESINPKVPDAPTSADFVQMAGEQFPGLKSILEYQPTTTGGRYTKAVTRQLPGAMVGPGGIGVKAVSAAGAGVAGQATHDALKGTIYESWSPFVETLATMAGGVGSAVGANRIALQRGLSDPASLRRILGELEAQGMTPQQATQRLQELGPDAFMADVIPEAAGATSRAGGARTINTALQDRMDRAPARVNRDLNQAYGPPMDPFNMERLTRAEKARIGQHYGPAYQNAPASIQSPALQHIVAVQLTGNAGRSMMRRAGAGRVMDWIDDAFRADTPAETASRLHGVRQDLDQLIVHDQRVLQGMAPAEKVSQGIYREARDVIDDILKNRVPGFRQADEAFVPVARQKQAYDKGYEDVLTSRVTPAEHAEDFRRYSPEEQRASRAGQRQRILLDTSNRRADTGLKTQRILSQNLNEPKTRTSIGQQRQEQLARALDREETFTETSNLADTTRNSRTAILNEAGNRMFGKGGMSMFGDAVQSGLVGMAGGPQAGIAAMGMSGLRRIAQRIGAGNGVSPELVQQVAQRMVAAGGNRDRLMQELATLAQRNRVPLTTMRNIAIQAGRTLIGQQAGAP